MTGGVLEYMRIDVVWGREGCPSDIPEPQGNTLPVTECLYIRNLGTVRSYMKLYLDNGRVFTSVHMKYGDNVKNHEW